MGPMTAREGIPVAAPVAAPVAVAVAVAGSGRVALRLVMRTMPSSAAWRARAVWAALPTTE